MILRDALEERVPHGLCDRLVHSELVTAFVEECRRAFNASAGLRSVDHDVVRRKLAQIEKKITNMLYQPTMKARMNTLETKRQN